MDRVCENCGTSWSVHDGPCATDEEKADAQALADVRTLDEWCGTYRQVYLERRGKGYAIILVDSTAEPDQKARGFHGPTPDAARHAAAEWIRSQR